MEENQKKMVEMAKNSTGDTTNQQTVSSEQKETPTVTNAQLIQEAKQAIFEELGITPERQDELTPIHQKIMEDIKQIFKDNGIEDLFERSFILNNISEKCDNVSKLYYLVANGERNNAEEEEENDDRRESDN